MTNELVNEKYEHSVNVAILMATISVKMNLTMDSIKLAFLIGLFHDLGRFKEVIRQEKFNNLTFDHGAYSNKILYNDGLINKFPLRETDALLVRKAIYFHNKKELGPMSDKESFFAKMLRDADKIDIIRVIANKLRVINQNPTDKVLNDYFNNLPIDLKDLHNSTDSIILYFSFIRDLSFNESIDVLEETKNTSKYLQSILVNTDFLDLYIDIKSYALNERGEKKYVKHKI